MRRIITLAFAAIALLFAMPLQAQTSQSVSRQMTLTITPFLSCVGTHDMDWGTHRRPDGPLFSSASSYLEWDCSTDPNASVNISFALAAAMINPSATGLTVPVTYGSASGYSDQNGVAFNPASGMSNDIVPTGHFVVSIGKPRLGGTDELIRADIANASSLGGGHYAATVVLNVTLNQ